MKIFIAGSTGYIGSYLYYFLEGQGSVTSLDYSDVQNGKEYINLDLTNTNKVNVVKPKLFPVITDDIIIIMYCGINIILRLKRPI